MFIPLYEALDGWILLPGYAPDGDSVRFFAKEPARFEALRRSRLLRRGATDGSVQLRLEGIDAPELHYAQACQPRGESARDALLAWLGVSGVQFAADATTAMKPGTGLALLSQRDPIVTAKSVASLDQLSGGRVIFGIGAGWNAEEMENHGTRYETRFKVMRERMLAMRALWTQE